MTGWNTLTNVQELNDAMSVSEEKPVVFFKHSTRCSISTMDYNRVEQSSAQLAEVAQCYYLDLIAYRDVSNSIAQELGVQHESPQVLVVKNKECTFSSSHYDIRPSEILNQI